MKKQYFSMKEAYFKALVDAMEDLVYVCGEDFEILYMNPAMIHYLGRDAVGERCYSAFFGNNGPCSWCRHKDVILGQKTVRHEITCPNDNKIYRVICTPVELEGRGQDVSLTILHDITDIRTAQKELEEKNIQLRHAQKMEALAQLAAGVAHDFNNILGSVMGYASLLKSIVKDNTEYHYADLIEKASRKASKLVERLMAFSVKGYKERSTFDLNECVAGVVDILKQTVHKGISIKVELGEDLPHITASRADVEHAIMNICLNAVHAMEDSSGGEPSGQMEIRTFFIREDKVPRSHNVLPRLGHSEFVAVEVKDTGHGIEEAAISKIFEPFYTTKDLSESTGLGLSMVYGIMESHQGLIGVESSPKGSVFTLYFPVSGELPLSSSTGTQIKESAEHMDLHPEKKSGWILVVDDEAMLRELLREVLESKGYSVITAEDGARAIETFKKRHGEIGLVILDMLMPGLSGLETFRNMKEIDPNVRVVIASGYVDKDKIAQVKREGVLDFIAKPFSVSELSSKVNRYLAS